MDLQLAGRTAVVTGGSAGIGAAIVHALAAEGCHVWFCGRNSTRVDAMLRSVEALPGLVQAAALDVTDSAAFRDWVQALGGFDIFIPNVSALSGDWANSIDTDIRATVQATEAALPCLQHSAHAAITYVGSKAGALGTPGHEGYGAAKAAMAHDMKSLSMRLLPAVRVNTVSPGDTLAEGGLWDRVRQNDPEKFAEVVARNPMRRLATPQEVARPARPPASWRGPTGMWMAARSGMCSFDGVAPIRIACIFGVSWSCQMQCSCCVMWASAVSVVWMSGGHGAVVISGTDECAAPTAPRRRSGPLRQRDDFVKLPRVAALEWSMLRVGCRKNLTLQNNGPQIHGMAAA